MASREKRPVFTVFLWVLVFFFLPANGAAEDRLEVFAREGSIVVSGAGYEAAISPGGDVEILLDGPGGRKHGVARIHAFYGAFVSGRQERFRKGVTDTRIEERTEEKITVRSVSLYEDGEAGYSHRVEEEFVFYAGENHFDISVVYTNLGEETGYVRIPFQSIPSSRVNRVYAFDREAGERTSEPFRLTDNFSFRGGLDAGNPVFGMASEGEGWKVEFLSLDNHPFQYHFITVGGRHYLHYFYYEGEVFRRAEGAERRFVLGGGESVSYSIRATVSGPG